MHNAVLAVSVLLVTAACSSICNGVCVCVGVGGGGGDYASYLFSPQVKSANPMLVGNWPFL